MTTFPIRTSSIIGLVGPIFSENSIQAHVFLVMIMWMNVTTHLFGVMICDREFLQNVQFENPVETEAAIFRFAIQVWYFLPVFTVCCGCPVVVMVGNVPETGIGSYSSATSWIVLRWGRGEITIISYQERNILTAEWSRGRPGLDRRLRSGFAMPIRDLYLSQMVHISLSTSDILI